jgi:serine/threonine protein kinase/biopolymer transport protein ExbD
MSDPAESDVQRDRRDRGEPPSDGPFDANLQPGAIVGGYRVEYLIGAGGVGAVYAAEEPTIKKRVAIKVLRRSFQEDPQGAARFEREARAANEIRHPNIVDVIAIGKLADGRPYLVMSLLEGMSLRERLSRETKLDDKEAWRIVREIAEGLAAAHEAGVVHRDLKPDNVFLERDGSKASRVRVLDFGIAKVQATDDAPDLAKLTATGTPIGTPAYMAPEQWWCEGVEARTDQYALGILLFEMLSGQRPFPSQQFVDLVQKHLHEAPPKLSDVGVTASEAVEALVAKLLAKAKEDRFATMADVIEAGDRAFGFASTSAATPERKALELAQTEALTPALSPRALAKADPKARADASAMIPIARDAYRRFLAIHAGILAFGFAGLAAVGYAGESRHSPIAWFQIAGWGAWLVFLFTLLGVVLMPWQARRRLVTGNASTLPFWLALAPAVLGTIGTYSGWFAIMRGAGTVEQGLALDIFSEGTYEANAARFMGFSAACLLSISLTAMPGVSGLASVTTTLSGAIGVRRREAIAAVLGLTLVMIAALALGAPSGGLVAGAAALVAMVGALLPTVHATNAARDEIERALAGLLAIGLSIGVAITRLEAREAALWVALTRAERVREIVAAQGERTATLVIAAGALLAVVAIEALRFVRLSKAGASLRPRAASAVLAIAITAAVIADLATHARFIDTRDELRARTAEQYSLFARLDPPRGDTVGVTSSPKGATALQVARDAVAVNAKGVARLAAIDSPEGAAHLTAELDRALAAAAAKKEPGPVDLSISIDREVRCDALVRIFRAARAAGVHHVELLLTRGEAPKLAPGAPPETMIVLRDDFGALAAELADDGVVLAPTARFGDVVAELSQTAARGPLKIAVPPK